MPFIKTKHMHYPKGNRWLYFIVLKALFVLDFVNFDLSIYMDSIYIDEMVLYE